MQTVQFIIDSFTSEQSTGSQTICHCELGETCTCPEGECVCHIHEKYNAIQIRLPEYFSSSRNSNKCVNVLMARLYDIENMKQIEGSMHSDLVMRDACADFYCCSTNNLYPIPMKFVISDNKSMFNVWFKDISGSIVDLDPAKVRVIIEMILSY